MLVLRDFIWSSLSGLVRFLTADEKQQRVSGGYDPETKQQSSRWKSTNSPRAKSRECSSFSLTSMGLFSKEFILVGQTINSAYCCDVIHRMHENVRRFRSEVWWQKNWLLHHDNAPTYVMILLVVSFLLAFLPRTYTRCSSPPFGLHAPIISSSSIWSF
jgi:hypothetical protein